ncbi:PLP-dependent aminotransferase family protein [Cryptosporangium japonicum]|uniref:PLP-dependent aminotransferase family protein n=1 Tax=Cryptosporangium japonicum TaxID=80872 RepID=A0ABP3DR48_9ACTN
MEPINLVERLGRWSSGRGPLYLLLAARIRSLVDEGELPPGTRLPPDRALAAELAVGRTTVVAAYDQLAVEGRIVRRQGSGTRVAGPPAEAARPTTDSPGFLHLLEPSDGVILLACAAPDAPPPELVDAYSRAVATLADLVGDIGYHPTGLLRLRRAIADRYTDRGVPTAPEQILVTTGGQQALSLIASALLRPGDRVLVETPTYPGALEAFREEAAVVRGLPIGLPRLRPAVSELRPALVYTIPSFHNPTGAVLSEPARRRLVTEAAGTVLVEDEVHVDLGFPDEPPPPPPLASHDDGVLTVGSLSKVAWGGLRVGWVRAPAPVISRLARLRAVHDLGGNVPAQLAAAELLPHLDALRERSASRRRDGHDHLRTELARALPDWHVPAVRGGQTLWIRLPRGGGGSFAQAALRHGVAVLPGAGLDATGGSTDHVRLHFLASHAELTEAVHRLALAWQSYDPHSAPAGPPPLAV